MCTSYGNAQIDTHFAHSRILVCVCYNGPPEGASKADGVAARLLSKPSFIVAADDHGEWRACLGVIRLWMASALKIEFLIIVVQMIHFTR